MLRKTKVCFSKRIENDEEAEKVRSHLIQEEFGKAIKSYYAIAKTDRFSQKLETSTVSVVIAKNLISLNSVQSLKRTFALLQ